MINSSFYQTWNNVSFINGMLTEVTNGNQAISLAIHNIHLLGYMSLSNELFS